MARTARITLLPPLQRPGFAVLLYLAWVLCAIPQGVAAQPANGSNPRHYIAVPGIEEGQGISLFTVQLGELPDRQVWRTDGTDDGTHALPVCPPCNARGCSSCGYRSFVPGPDGVFVGVGSAAAGGGYAWTDGTGEGTIPMPPGPRLTGADPAHYSAALEGLLFVARGPSFQPQLWFWSGGPDPAIKLLEGPQTLDGFADGTDRVFIKASVGFQQFEIWSTDGTTAGTVRLGPVPGQVESSSPLTAVGNRALLVVGRLPCRLQVWIASEAGVERLTTLATDFCLLHVVDLATHGGTAYFLAESDAHGFELWSSDGTAAGTQRLTDFANPYPFDVYQASELAPLGDEVYFSALGADDHPDLWRSDGTLGGTRKVRALCAADCTSASLFRVVSGETLTWVESDGDGSSTLWTSDGSELGSRPRATAPWEPPAFQILTLAGGTWFTIAESGSDGVELHALRPGEANFTTLTDFADPFALFPGVDSWGALDDQLLFTARELPGGPEPWISDGTRAGTRLLAESELTTDLPPPSAPVLRAAEALPGGQVRLTVERADSLLTTGDFLVDARWPGNDWTPVAFADHFASQITVEFLTADTPYTFRVQATNPSGISGWSEARSARTLSEVAPSPVCQANSTRLCLGNGRFGVQVAFWNQHGGSPVTGEGRPLDGVASDRSGYFWFFRPDNVELVVKVLDGGAVNGHAWLFYGALSDVEYWVTLTDHSTGQSRTYRNPPGEICGVADTTAFPSGVTGNLASGSRPPQLQALELPSAASKRRRGASHSSVPCVEDAATLCLLDDRYAVTVDWDDHHNDRSGVGGAVPYADRTGFFWFFREDNIELVVKVLDGTPVNGKTWVFYGALTDVGYALTVTDTATGHTVETYVNEPGNICGGADTEAF